MVRTLASLLRGSLGLLGAATLCSLASGAASVALLALITRTLAGTQGGLATALVLFAVLVVGVVAGRLASQLMLVRLWQAVVFRLRMRVVRGILATDLRGQELAGKHRLAKIAVDRDVHDVSYALMRVPDLIPDFITAACLLGYIGSFSPLALGGVLVTCVLVIVVNVLPRPALQRRYAAQRESDEVIGNLYFALVDGAKELKLHAPRRRAFLGELLVPALEAQSKNVIGARLLYLLGEEGGRLLYYLAVGVLILALAGRVSPSALSALVLAALGLMGPLGALVDTLPRVRMARLAVAHLDSLGVLDKGAAPEPTPPPLTPPRLVQLRAGTHAYEPEPGGPTFVLGPIDVELRAGQVTFIVGDNGSGKTTLCKLLSGLYRPATGELVVDGQALDADRLPAYTAHVSALFFDSYVFDRLLGLDAPDRDARARALLERLELEQKVQLDGGRFSTLALSFGQRKRLGLLVAQLEDRQIYLFDEWAAGQSPQFKALFYEQLLPELRRRGKIVVAVTHDEEYFATADQLLRVENGRLEVAAA